MSNSDKNIVITPNIGSSSQPQIAFTGLAATTITLKVLDDSYGSLSWEGSAGQLFSINNNLTSGSIFSVNDVSGIPSIDVNANGTVSMVSYGGNVAIGSTGLTGTSSQKLQVTGGAYVSGNLGIGVTNPTAKLQVNSVIKIDGTSNPYLTLTDNSSNTGYLQIATGLLDLNHNGNISFSPGASEKVRITSGGNLGIGITNPQSALHITGQFQSTQANSTTTGDGQIYLNGATGNRIDFNANGATAPAFTTRSAGTKIVLYPQVGASSVDYGIGVESTALWNSIPDSTVSFKWYAGTTNIATLSGAGTLTATTFSGSGASLTTLNASNLSSGTVATARLGTGTADATTYLRGDSTWATVSGGGATLNNSPSGTLYPTMSSAVSGTYSTAYTSSTALTFTTSTGTLSATQFTSLSDVNKKKNIRPIENAIDITKKLEGVKFDWIDNDEPSMGVIAQDVEKVLPELVIENDGIKSVSYGNLVGVLIEAIKEQQVRIEELEKKMR